MYPVNKNIIEYEYDCTWVGNSGQQQQICRTKKNKIVLLALSPQNNRY